jgi:Glucodextranase, domain B/PASTA domain
MRPATLIGACCAALTPALAGCGGDDTRREPSPRPVRLQVTAPADAAIVRGATVDVRGRVSPAGANVWVLGRPAQVSRGAFTAVVPLEHGANVVDVAAAAGGRRAALAALRVTRDERVAVPDLAGVAAGDVERELAPLGLRVEVSRSGGLLDRLLPGEAVVCEQAPAAGARVRRGRTVRVVVARTC